MVEILSDQAYYRRDLILLRFIEEDIKKVKKEMDKEKKQLEKQNKKKVTNK